MENKVEKFIIVEILEKIYRLKKFITAKKNMPRSQGNKATIEVFEIALKKIEANLINPIEVLKRDSFSSETRYSVNRRLSTTFHLITRFHAKLKYIYSDWVRPETFTFTNRLLQELPEKHADLNLNIILSDDYSFKENNLINKFNEILRESQADNISKEHRYPTFFLPKIEYSNPLNWAILAHEMAHINEEEVKAFVEDPRLIPPGTSTEHTDVLKRWAEEIYCDIFAVNLLGPAYFASFVSFALATTGLGGNVKNSFSHPSNMLRIRMLHEHLTRNKATFELDSISLGKFEINSFFHRMIEDFDKIDRQLMGNTVSNGYDIKDLTHFTDFIREYSKSFIHGSKIEESEIRVYSSLRSQLERGITIGSCGTHDKEKVLKELTEGSIDFDIIKDAISERGTSIREILNAGWSNKIVNSFPSMVNYIFSLDNNDLSKCIEMIGRIIEESDDRLLKSIETSELYYLLERDTYGTV